MIKVLPLFLLVASLTPTIMASSSELSVSINQFSVDLYKTLSAGNSKNLVMSPLSAQTVLALVYQGADGNTATQLSSGLHLSLSKEQSQDDIHDLMVKLNSQTGVTLEIANKVYAMTGYTLKPTFKEIAVSKFLADSENINFAENVKSAAAINSWVEQKTHDKIKDLISADSLNSDTRLVLLNAIYFKGSWAKKFNADLTEEKPFYISETESVPVQMMRQNSKFRYAELADLNAKVVELPYKDSDLSMLIILPDSRTGLAALEQKLETVNLKDISQRMYEVEVNLQLPKFKIESELNLVEPLKKLGMVDMFTNAADFSGLLDSPEPLYVSDVIQKAFIEVNEEGAEAAAATADDIEMRMMPIIQDMIVDHGFLFHLVIVQETNLHSVFVGQYNLSDNANVGKQDAVDAVDAVDCTCCNCHNTCCTCSVSNSDTADEDYCC